MKFKVGDKLRDQWLGDLSKNYTVICVLKDNEASRSLETEGIWDPTLVVVDEQGNIKTMGQWEVCFLHKINEVS